jgi:hypothetical protein
VVKEETSLAAGDKTELTLVYFLQKSKIPFFMLCPKFQYTQNSLIGEASEIEWPIKRYRMAK